jgi:hypothetical protein
MVTVERIKGGRCSEDWEAEEATAAHPEPVYMIASGEFPDRQRMTLCAVCLKALRSAIDRAEGEVAMGKRSQGKGKWGKRHDAPTQHTVRLWICAECKSRGCTLINCRDGKQRCPRCADQYNDRVDAEMGIPGATAAIRHEPPPAPIIHPAGQVVRPPRVG